MRISLNKLYHRGSFLTKKNLCSKQLEKTKSRRGVIRDGSGCEILDAQPQTEVWATSKLMQVWLTAGSGRALIV